MNAKQERDAQMDTLARGSRCTRCGVLADEPCRTPKGRETFPHKARIDRAVKQYVAALDARKQNRFAYVPNPDTPKISHTDTVSTRNLREGDRIIPMGGREVESVERSMENLSAALIRFKDGGVFHSGVGDAHAINRVPEEQETPTVTRYEVECQEDCNNGTTHEATYSHDDQYSGKKVYVAVCNGYEDTYTEDVVRAVEIPEETPESLGLTLTTSSKERN